LDANIGEAITVLIVGMTTVFIILSLVVLSGNILIRVLNRLGFVLNEEQIAETKTAAVVGTAATAMATQSLPSGKQAAIEKAIREWSGGKAEVKKITKI